MNKRKPSAWDVAVKEQQARFQDNDVIPVQPQNGKKVKLKEKVTLYLDDELLDALDGMVVDHKKQMRAEGKRARMNRNEFMRELIKRAKQAGGLL